MRVLAHLAVALALGLAAAAAAPAALLAQEVLIIAPQLQAFAGSPANFESLATGLRTGTEVTVTTLAEDGTQQIVRFTAAQPLSAADTARVLEAARQRLIANGIGVPGARDIGVALMGGTLATPSGTARLDGLLEPADPKAPLAVTSTMLAGSAANYKSLVRGLGDGSAVTLSTPGKAAVIFTAPGGPLSAEEVKQTLQTANELLAAQGIRDPTPEQLRAALVGGSVASASGAQVRLRGVLEGRTKATSASPQAGSTSQSRGQAHTSDRPPAGFTSDAKPQGHTSDRPSTGFTSDRKLP